MAQEHHSDECQQYYAPVPDTAAASREASAISDALLAVYRSPNKPASKTKAEKASAAFLTDQILAGDNATADIDRMPTPSAHDVMAFCEHNDFLHDKMKAELNKYSASEIQTLVALVNSDLKKKHSIIRVADMPNGKLAVGKIHKDGVEFDYELSTKPKSA